VLRSISAYVYECYELAYGDDFVAIAEVVITSAQSVVPPVGEADLTAGPGYSVMESVTARNLPRPLPGHPPTPHY
jgi:hypothetical protein